MAYNPNYVKKQVRPVGGRESHEPGVLAKVFGALSGAQGERLMNEFRKADAREARQQAAQQGGKPRGVPRLPEVRPRTLDEMLHPQASLSVLGSGLAMPHAPTIEETMAFYRKRQAEAAAAAKRHWEVEQGIYSKLQRVMKGADAVLGPVRPDRRKVVREYFDSLIRHGVKDPRAFQQVLGLAKAGRYNYLNMNLHPQRVVDSTPFRLDELSMAMRNKEKTLYDKHRDSQIPTEAAEKILASKMGLSLSEFRKNRKLISDLWLRTSTGPYKPLPGDRLDPITQRLADSVPDDATGIALSSVGSAFDLFPDILQEVVGRGIGYKPGQVLEDEDIQRSSENSKKIYQFMKYFGTGGVVAGADAAKAFERVREVGAEQMLREMGEGFVAANNPFGKDMSAVDRVLAGANLAFLAHGLSHAAKVGIKEGNYLKAAKELRTMSESPDVKGGALTLAQSYKMLKLLDMREQNSWHGVPIKEPVGKELRFKKYLGKVRTHYDSQHIMMARRLDEILQAHQTSNINTPERIQLRSKLLKKMQDEYTQKERTYGDQPVATIVLGRPGSGKSTAVSNEILRWPGARLLDLDAITRELPEYTRSAALGRVRNEAAQILDQLHEHAIHNREDLIWSTLGTNPEYVQFRLKQLKDAGYHVDLRHVHVDEPTAVGRSTKRWYDRAQNLVDADFISNVLKEKSFETYNQLKHRRDLVDSYRNVQNQGNPGASKKKLFKKPSNPVFPKPKVLEKFGDHPFLDKEPGK